METRRLPRGGRGERAGGSGRGLGAERGRGLLRLGSWRRRRRRRRALGRTTLLSRAAPPPAAPPPPARPRRRLPPPQTALSPRASRLRYGDPQPQRRGEQLGPPGPWRRRPVPEARGRSAGSGRRGPGPGGGGRPQPPGFGRASHPGGWGDGTVRSGWPPLMSPGKEGCVWEERVEMAFWLTCAACERAMGRGRGPVRE